MVMKIKPTSGGIVVVVATPAVVGIGIGQCGRSCCRGDGRGCGAAAAAVNVLLLHVADIVNTVHFDGIIFFGFSNGWW